MISFDYVNYANGTTLAANGGGDKGRRGIEVENGGRKEKKGANRRGRRKDEGTGRELREEGWGGMIVRV